MNKHTSVSFSEDELPEIKDWKVGKKYKVRVVMEMTGLNKRPDFGMGEPMEMPEKKLVGDFKVLAVKPALVSKSLLDMDDKKFMKQLPKSFNQPVY